jgi:hypothetical protein
VRDLRRDHIKVAHRDPSNNSFKNILSKWSQIRQNENSSKNTSENAEKENEIKGFDTRLR